MAMRKPLIGKINPGSIRTTTDMTRALPLVIEDVLSETAHVDGIDLDDKGRLDVCIDDGAAVFVVRVVDYDRDLDRWKTSGK
jgi:hypothetical protein